MSWSRYEYYRTHSKRGLRLLSPMIFYRIWGRKSCRKLHESLLPQAEVESLSTSRSWHVDSMPCKRFQPLICSEKIQYCSDEEDKATAHLNYWWHSHGLSNRLRCLLVFLDFFVLRHFSIRQVSHSITERVVLLLCSWKEVPKWLAK